MTRYYLHFHYPDTFFQDEEGVDFGSLHDAELDAIASIHDLAVSSPRRGRASDLLSICITNIENDILAVLISRKVLAAHRPQR
ncbi:DUF6894 family protein [Rhizobium sp. YIM 134829]|uniref:DUF6894 family protein n=1 Tax=Rhizobium sp. YIM 134829 TaxID=3390453 RepID=UPI00397DDB37